MKDAFINIDPNEIFDSSEKLEFEVPSEYEDNTLFGIELNLFEPVSIPSSIATLPPTENKPINVGQIAGMVIGSVLVVFVFVFLVYGIAIQTRKREESIDTNQEEATT